ncbi:MULTISPECIES: MaoC family dehydratase [unclassified Cupriavidus]|uniref:MaoC family dehydratase n=1 Tax=unclassified Cupriavidus TaxID=2640874 RepID=UPI001C007CE4|nr:MULTISPECIES: MaoC family dehydratase [unclassified Cupriavidus]MCA3189152.1 MaoC family dehydratase [Cupriavidus sp.]MCA3198872.1 MaoC family dehydratase [Cupriavidus sp.]MCA3201616.1 MaoC family dehydratase [Cupriavidus sp.]MCA3233856.1 MaoC family dehydratase [Cupriavidus sp.]QWE97157.1 MaoC family dehydratase [Cupriavidus sp. EM10]
MTTRIRSGNFFEDFHLGQVIRHGTPRTVTEADASLYIALTGARHLAHSAHTAARLLGYENRPLDDLLVFNIAFGKTVPDISLNAVANLGYAELRFVTPAFSGDTLRSESVVIGLKENSSRKSGIVYVRSTCYNQHDQVVLSWVRWVMVHKRLADSAAAELHVPVLAALAPIERTLVAPLIASADSLDEWCDMSGAEDLWDDYLVGDRINHPSGMTLEEADHMLATRLYQNNARAHFDALAMRDAGVGQRLIYGGHVMSVCRALSYDGLENVIGVIGINAGSHTSPSLAGDTLYAYTEVIDKRKLPGRHDIGVLRLRLVGLKNTPAQDVASASQTINGVLEYHSAVVLDLDYTVLMPRRWQNRNQG